MHTDDEDILADIAHYSFDRYILQSSRSESPDASGLDRAIDFGTKAVAATGTDLEALYYLGLSYEAAGKLQNAADTLLLAYDLNASVPRLNHGLARVLVEGGQTELATRLVSRLYSASHSEQARARYVEIRDALAEDEPDLSAIAAMF